MADLTALTSLLDLQLPTALDFYNHMGEVGWMLDRADWWVLVAFSFLLGYWWSLRPTVK